MLADITVSKIQIQNKIKKIQIRNSKFKISGGKLKKKNEEKRKRN